MQGLWILNAVWGSAEVFQGDESEPMVMVANKGVEQGGFASLELTETSYIETSFGNPRCEFARFLGNRLSSKFLR